LNALSDSGASKSIAVSSRLYHRAPNARKPLSGIRVAIPDVSSLLGVQTTLSSHAWRALHALPAAATSTLADRLLALGAVIVGKTKSSQFGEGQEWVDEQAPWSPREDGYQKPGRGAAGSGAGVAGYEWLKAAFGIDGKHMRPDRPVLGQMLTDCRGWRRTRTRRNSRRVLAPHESRRCPPRRHGDKFPVSLFSCVCATRTDAYVIGRLTRRGL